MSTKSSYDRALSLWMAHAQIEIVAEHDRRELVSCGQAELPDSAPHNNIE